MNMICVMDAQLGKGKPMRVRTRAFVHPGHAANLPAARHSNARVGKFEDMNLDEASAVLSALEEALA